MKKMKPIQSSLKKWIDENEDFKQRHAAMKTEILSHPRVVEFINKHPQISDKTIEKRLNKLYEYMTQSDHCEQCKGYQSCANMMQGYRPKLSYVLDDIHLAYEKCDYHLHYEKVIEKQQLIQSVYMPKEILHAKLSDLYIDPSRTEAIKEIDVFLRTAKQGLPKRGIFFTGPFGVGKTYFLGAIANELQKMNISSTLIYMPEFVREIRASIQDNTVQDKINFFKEAEVLMLDDIGAETLSAWFRDEVLGSILQYRMMENLPVFFTSNYTMDQLEEILATSTKGGVESVKAGRIMERIRQVSKEVAVIGTNYRK